MSAMVCRSLWLVSWLLYLLSRCVTLSLTCELCLSHVTGFTFSGPVGKKKATTPTDRGTMALRMIYDKAMGFAAKQYQTVLGNQLAQYGEYWCDGVERVGGLRFWGFSMT